MEAIEINKNFSQEDLTDAALVIANRLSAAANMYLHIKNDDACRNYILHHMEKLPKYN
jgi:hypothetical protein